MCRFYQTATFRLRLLVLAVSTVLTGCALLDTRASNSRSIAGESFVFTAVGDLGTSNDTTATLESMARAGTDFHLALGDLSYSSAIPEASWCDYVTSKVGATVPVQLVPGNHEDDYGADGHISRFAACLPDRMNSTGEYARQYYFDYRHLARSIIISPDLTIDGRHYYYGRGNANYQWVASAIDGARASAIPWVILAMHKNCLSVGQYSCNIYQDLMDLPVEKKVDLVLQAHDHTYQRTRQLATGNACPSVVVDTFNRNCVTDDGEDNDYIKGRGPVFVVVGTGGANLYDVNPNDPEAGYFVKWMGANANPRKGFAKVRVSKTQIAVEFVGSTATSNFTDSFRIRVAE